MLILATTTDKIQVVLGSAITTNQLDCIATYKDITSSAYGGSAPNLVSTNNTTAVDLVAAPASSTQRIVDFISVFNSDTVNAVVTVRINRNGTTGILFKCTLGTGELVTYTEGQGWVVYANNGSVKQATVNGNNPITSAISRVILGSDVVNNNATANTIADVTGLSCPVTAGTVTAFRFVIFYSAPSSTTGARWAVNGPASPTQLAYTSRYPLTAIAETINYANAYDIPAAANGTSLTTGNIAVIEGFIKPSANGTLIARFASEVSSSAITALAGSYLEYQNTL